MTLWLGTTGVRCDVSVLIGPAWGIRAGLSAESLPERVGALVACLVHELCEPGGEVFTGGGGRRRGCSWRRAGSYGTTSWAAWYAAAARALISLVSASSRNPSATVASVAAPKAAR